MMHLGKVKSSLNQPSPSAYFPNPNLTTLGAVHTSRTLVISYIQCILYLYIHRNDISHCCGVCALKKFFSVPIILQPAFSFFMTVFFEILLHKYITILFSQSSVDRQLGGFQLFTVTNNSAMDIRVDALLGSEKPP